MSHTLISFLGKSKMNPETGYRTACYDFNGTHKTTAFFGIALTEMIQPDKLIIVGTSGSMWDVFFEHSAMDDEDIIEHIDALAHAVKENKVTKSLLAPCMPYLQNKWGCEVEYLLIDYAKDEVEQIKLLLKIAKCLQQGTHISLDVTHSFRHLPMLALVAARYLHIVKDITTDNIYYGALEMTSEDTKLTPVIKLEGLLTMLDWVDALASYDKDGDYQPLAELYRDEGQHEAAEALSKAAFYEKTNQIGQARAPLRKFREIDIVTPINSLFIGELNRRTEWVEGENFAQRQLDMAKHYLEKSNYLRTAILAQEALLSYLTQTSQAGSNPESYKNRQEAKENFDKAVKKTAKSQRTELQQAYEELRHIRNALAHGTKVKTQHLQSAFTDEAKLRAIMQQSLHTISKTIKTKG